MTKTWVVVADANRARIFFAKGPLAPLYEEGEIANPDLIPAPSDRPGRGFGRTGTRRSSHEPKVLPKQQALTLYAKQVADYLAKARSAGKYTSLVLVAAPGILGKIRNNLDERTAKLLSKQVRKDLARLPAAELRKQIA